MKLWKKIILIVLCIIIIAIASIVPLMNHYLKKSILRVGDKMLNAELNIDKVRVNIFKRTLSVYDVRIFDKDVHHEDLLKIEKLTVGMDDFERSTGEVSLDEILLESLNLKIIVDELGNNKWTEIINTDFDSETNIQKDFESKFSLFVHNINVLNSNIKYYNKAKDEVSSLSDFNISAKFTKEQKAVNSNYSISFDLLNPKILCGETNNIQLSGKSLYMSNLYKIESENEIILNNLIVDNKFSYYFKTDVETEHNNSLEFRINLNKMPQNLRNYYSGNLSLVTNFSGGIMNLIDNNKIAEISTEIKINDLIIKNDTHKDRESRLYIDADMSLLTKLGDKLAFYLSTNDNTIIKLNDKSIKGFIGIEINEEHFRADNNMKGEIFLKDLNPLFKKDIISSGSISANSKTKGVLNKSRNSLINTCAFAINDFKAEYCDDKFFNLRYLNLSLNRTQAQFKADIKTNSKDFKADIKIPNIRSMYLDNDLLIQSAFKINRINIPDLGSRSMNLEPENFKRDSLSDKSRKFFFDGANLEILFTADTIFVADNYLFNNNFNISLSSDKFAINNFYSELGNGVAEASISISTLKDNMQLNTIKVNLKDLDLAYINYDDKNVFGNLNLSFDNKIYTYSGTDKADYINNSIGDNTIMLNNFKYENTFAKQYGFGHDYFNIDSLELRLSINGDSIKLHNFQTSINEIKISSGAQINRFTDKISSVSLVQLPNSLVPPQSRMLISRFATKHKSDIKIDKNYMNLLIRLNGSLSAPDYEVLELY